MSLKITEEAIGLLDMVNLNFGPELHTDANAASDPNGNEADATTGWTQNGLLAGNNVFESQGSVKHTGSYALHSDANDTPTSNADFQKEFTVDNGSSYQISFYTRHIGSGGDWRLLVNDGGGFADIAAIQTASTTFYSIIHTAVMSGTTLTVIFRENNGTDNGGVYVDNLSIRKKL